MEKLVTGDKALATALGVSTATISRMNKEGRLNEARLKIGRRLNAYDIEKVLTILKY